MKLAIITAHAGADSLQDAAFSWTGMQPLCRHAGYWMQSNPCVYIADGTRGMLPAYQRGLEESPTHDILAYFHDDTIINEPAWLERVLKEFEDPQVGLVGFGGALGHGSPEIYRAPYDYHQLGRAHFLSNMEDAENHGQRFTGSSDVAVLDGFSLIVRREILENAGGWPVKELGYVGYDYWLSCMTRRQGYRIRVVGVVCAHLGGRTFVKLGIGQDPKHWQQFLDAHRYIYDEFKDVLPYRVNL